MYALIPCAATFYERPHGAHAPIRSTFMATYHSTRSRTAQLSAKEAIRRGIAPDGGLYVSDELG